MVQSARCEILSLAVRAVRQAVVRPVRRPQPTSTQRSCHCGRGGSPAVSTSLFVAGIPSNSPACTPRATMWLTTRSPSATWVLISWRAPGAATRNISAPCFIPSRSRLTPGYRRLCATKSSAMYSSRMVQSRWSRCRRSLGCSGGSDPCCHPGTPRRLLGRASRLRNLQRRVTRMRVPCGRGHRLTRVLVSARRRRRPTPRYPRCTNERASIEAPLAVDMRTRSAVRRTWPRPYPGHRSSPSDSSAFSLSKYASKRTRRSPSAM